MRNLRLISEQILQDPLLSNCQAVTFENDGFFYFVNDESICKFDLQTRETESLVPLSVIENAEQILDVKHNVEEDSLSIVSSGGSVVVVDIKSYDIEVVGDVAGGISSCGWSPDNETFVLVTAAGKVLLMTRTWDVINEVPLFEGEFGEGQFITVGWGSKETQFHGSEGKDARVKPQVNAQLSEWDDQKPRITWRADGQFFAVNAVDPSTGFRRLRVFNREGVLQYTSEDVFQLEQSLSWRSTGASGLITTTVTTKQPPRQQVAFFEKNGLRHGEFDLLPGTQVLESSWNVDSSVLALVMQNPTAEGKLEQSVQLWTTSNYHWYLKRHLTFESDVRVLHLVWDPLKTFRLYLVLSNGQYRQMDFALAVDRSSGLNSSNDACVAVIDGRSLKLTPFRKSVIPPPMCAYEVSLPAAINEVGFLHSASDLLDSNSFFVTTSTNSLYFFRKSDSTNSEKKIGGVVVSTREGLQSETYSPVAAFTLPPDLYHFTWSNSETAVACKAPVDEKTEIIVFTLTLIGENPSFEIRNSIDVPSSVLRICGNGNQVFIGVATGQVYTLDLVSNILDVHATFPEPCIQLERAVNQVGEVLLIGLSESGRLYVNSREVLSSINSFCLHSHFLLCTSTQQHELICISLPTLGNTDQLQFVARRVERGSRLVHSVPAGTCTVLQMPRGNLEAIHPRPLTIYLLKDLIDRHRYLEAFVLMKKQRINMNLLCDHNLKDFLENISLLVEQLGTNVSNLNLFLTDLTEEDFTSTMYADYYRENQAKLALPGGKVDTICVALREQMRKANNDRYISPILTSYVKLNVPDLAGALRTVQNIHSESGKDEALKYLTVLVDADKLYNEALATYDLHLTLMVAQRSQKDPKEYLPFLNELNAIPDEHMRKFSVDNHLRRYESALKNLCVCRPIKNQEIFNYVKLHRLYGMALDELILVEEPQARELVESIAPLYAESLIVKGNYEEAAFVYQRANLQDKAVECYHAALMWKPCLALARHLNYEDSRIKDLALKLASRLRSTKKYSDAAYIYESYIRDDEQTLSCMIEGHLFQEAWAFALKNNMNNWINSKLVPALEETLEATGDRLDRLESEFDNFVQRLNIVRINLQEKRLATEVPEVHGDLFSDAGSTIASSQSASSGKTFRSSKNRRKMERKKFQLKEGSQWEDFAIIHAVYNQLLALPALVDEVSALLRSSVVILTDWSRPRNVQNKLEKLLRHMDEDKKKVWNFQVVEKNTENEDAYGPSATVESIIQQKNLASSANSFLSVRYRDLDHQYYYPPEVKLDSGWKIGLLR